MNARLEDLGYEIAEDNIRKDGILIFVNKKENCRIAFFAEGREVHKYHEYLDNEGYITMEELKAIYKYCEDNKWI